MADGLAEPGQANPGQVWRPVFVRGMAVAIPGIALSAFAIVWLVTSARAAAGR